MDLFKDVEEIGKRVKPPYDCIYFDMYDPLGDKVEALCAYRILLKDYGVFAVTFAGRREKEGK